MNLKYPAAMSTRPNPAGTVYVLDEPKAIEEVQVRDDRFRQVVQKRSRQTGNQQFDRNSCFRERHDDGTGRGRFCRPAVRSLPRERSLRPWSVFAPCAGEKYAEIRPDEAALEAVLGAGAAKAQAISGPIVAEARNKMGLGPTVG